MFKMPRAYISVVVVMLASFTAAQQNQAARPSPPGTAELTLNGKKVSIAYSRPKIRDPKTGQPRKIFGGLVPYGKVWRTGANEATTLKTEGDLTVGGVEVPAGSHELVSIPESDRWTLIISKKPGGGELPYPGEGEDLARVPMKVEHPSQVIDPFTISLEPPGGSAPAKLCLAWENTKSCVDLVAK